MPLDPELQPHVTEAARLNNLDPALLQSLLAGESSYDPSAVSPKGAVGIAQFMPETAAKMGIDPRDPVQGIYGAASLLNKNLTYAEQLRQSGQNVNPVDYALRMYFGGEEGPQWGPKTAAYPGQIYNRYRQIAGQAEPGTPLSQAPQAPQGQFSTGAAPFTKTNSVGEQYRWNGEGWELLGQPAAPNVQGGTRGAGEPSRGPIPPDPTSGPVTPVNGARMNDSIAALAGAGQPQNPAPTPMQLAQAGGSAIPTDAELLQGLKEVSPMFAGQSPAVAQVQGPIPNQPASAAPAQAQPTTAPSGQAVLGPEQVIQLLNTAGAAKGGIAAIPGLMSGLETMIKNGTQFVRMPDGSIGIGRIGGAAEAKNQMEAAGAAGGKEQTYDPATNQIAPMPGAIPSAAAEAGAVQRQKTRQSIYEQRPGGVPRTGAEIQDAAEGAGASGPAGSGVPGQSPLYNNPGIGKGEDLAAEQYAKLRDTFGANQAAAQNLRNFLDAASVVGTGKGTELSGAAAAWLKSLNIDPQKLSLADPAEVEKMQKAANQMIVTTVKGISSRPAYADFNFVGQGLVDPEKQPEANRAIAAALLGRMNWENSLFKTWDADRRSPQAAGSYGHFDFPAWAEANPMPAFQASAFQTLPPIPQRGVTGQTEPAPQFREGQTIKNPQTGERRVFRGGQWVPVQ